MPVPVRPCLCRCASSRHLRADALATRPVADADAPYPLGHRLLEVTGLEVGVLVGGGHEEDGPQDHQQVCS